MAISLSEKPNQRELTQNPPSVKIPYVCDGEDDETTVMSYALGTVPLQISSPFGQLFRTDIQVTRTGYYLYDVFGVFTKEKKSVGEWQLSFDGSGGTRTQFFSYETTRYPDTIPDNGGLIGVDAETGEVKGIEVIEPSCKINVRFKFAEGQFNQAFINLVSRQVGKMNSKRFLGWKPGEVLFVAPSGSEGSETETEVSFQLWIQENLERVTIGAVENITKRGWDAIEPYSITQVVAGVPIKKPAGFYVHQVYRTVDLAAVLGFGR